MTHRVHVHPNLIYAVGAQVVRLADVTGPGRRTLHPWGAVGVIVKSPSDDKHTYPNSAMTGLWSLILFHTSSEITKHSCNRSFQDVGTKIPSRETRMPCRRRGRGNRMPIFEVAHISSYRGVGRNQSGRPL